MAPELREDSFGDPQNALFLATASNLAYEPPFLFARRMATLDHLTDGRIGWNIVTGYLDSAARAMGFAAQVEHDDRYDLAEVFLEVGLVITSITLLSGRRLFWYLGVFLGGIGIILAATGYFVH